MQALIWISTVYPRLLLSQRTKAKVELACKLLAQRDYYGSLTMSICKALGLLYNNTLHLEGERI